VKPTAPWVLGIAASHNGGACLLHGDEIAVAVQEERLLRNKRTRTRGACDPLSVRYCLESAGVRPEELSAIVLCAAQSNQSAHNDVDRNGYLRPQDHGVRVYRIPHHLGHAVGAFATSGLASAAVLVVDGMGSPHEDLTADEQRVLVGRPAHGHETISLYVASDRSMQPLEKHLVDDGAWLERRLPHAGMHRFGSLGGMYSAVAEQIFGDPLDGAGKVMGLAPYGTANTASSDFFDVVDGAFRFSETVSSRFEHTERWPARQDEYCDLAASVQRALEEALLYLTRHLCSISGEKRLCYAGGVALNSVANERIVRESGFEDVFFMPAAEDSGTAIGAAYFGLWQLGSAPGSRATRRDSLGKTYSQAEIGAAIDRAPAIIARRSEHPAQEAARLLAEGKIVGWFQGGSELGPRALGQRSILADARRADTKERINRLVKGREAFRPFAPVVLQEDVASWFDVEPQFESPYMLRVCRFRAEAASAVPAVVHVDGTGRVQTIRQDEDPLLCALLREFKAGTNVPMLLNTSFNVSGEPIVETPQDALWTLLNCGLDALMIGDQLVTKQSAYQSVLDLRGTLAAGSFTVRESSARQPNANGYQRLPCAFSEAAQEWMFGELDAPGLRYATFRVTTPWGVAIHAFPADVVDVATRLDGRSSGRAILEQLARVGDARDEQWMAATLRAFGAVGIARFR
jgi:carbamoyltransferase